MTDKKPLSKNAEPIGELVLQTVAKPADSNSASGDIFGGWLVAQMDLGGSVMAHHRSRNRMATVAIDRIVFLKPVFVGDLVACYAHVEKTGNSSITIKVQVWVTRLRVGEREQVTEGIFTFVALDEAGRPKPINWAVNQ